MTLPSPLPSKGGSGPLRISQLPGLSPRGRVVIARLEQTRLGPGQAERALRLWRTFLRDPYHRLWDGRIFLFAAGASVAFAAVNAVVTRGFRTRVQTEPPVALALATSLSVLSISAGAGVAALLGVTLGNWLAWLLSSLLSTWVYLSVAALEMAASRALHLNLGERDPEER